MSVLDVIFLVMSALMLGSSLMVITSRNQVYAAMWLVASMFFLAAIYALLGAHTIAILQVLVYAGAIVVLFLFVIMLLNIQESPPVPLLQSLSIMRVLAVAAAVGVGVVLVAVSLSAPMRTKVKSVTHDMEGNLVLTFDASPFRGSMYAAGNLGTGKTETGGTFDVMRVTSDMKHVVVPGSVLPNVGEVVELTPAAAMLRPEFGTVAELGNQMYGPDLLAFEVTSLLLLVSIVGAVVVAKGKILMVNPGWAAAVAGLMLAIGVAGVLTRRSALIVFMSVEMMLNAANLTFLAYARARGDMNGHVVAFFVMAVAAAEAAVGLAVMIAVFRSRGTLNVDEVDLMKN